MPSSGILKAKLGNSSLKTSKSTTRVSTSLRSTDVARQFSVQVYDGNGDNRTDEERAYEKVMETIREHGEKSRAELMKTCRFGVSTAQAIRIDAAIKEQTDKMIAALTITARMLKLK